VRDIPYDRANTSMAVFPMCADCQREYDDPRNRRFHAQPNACWRCGPHVELWDSAGQRIDAADPILTAIKLLASGEIVAVKGLGGFHLAVDAMNATAVARLRERKRRVEKPFAIMAALADLEEFCLLDDIARKLLKSAARPIVLLKKRIPERPAPTVAPFNLDLGVFLPYTPLHHLLFAERRFVALVMTSGNISEEPIAIDNAEAVERLRGIADYFLVHNREILLRADDSVMRVSGARARQVRRSRGYVPAPIFLQKDVPPILAVGAELKNTICITRGKEAFLSQHIGDLENLESYKFFESTVKGLERILQVEPQILAYDLHPDYFSTRWALAQQGMELVGVQHHHAHIASCMAENHLDGRVIGFALDGTGYGTDGHVWGGEVLACDFGGFERVAHLDYIPMPGGSAAILEPRRMAVSYLFRHFGREFWNLDIPFVRALDRRRTENLLKLIENGINAPLTSSTGRLFDAVAALIGVRENVNYEAQAAIELESAIDDADARSGYPFGVREDGDGWIIDTQPVFLALIEDLRAGVSNGISSHGFHLGFAEALARVAVLVRERTGLVRVCLSGGSFQNSFLFQHLQERLQRAGFRIFTHADVPCGDGGISLGQAMIAAHRCGRQGQMANDQ
jgi:hydrogenase maturation protein HypF